MNTANVDDYAKNAYDSFENSVLEMQEEDNPDVWNILVHCASEYRDDCEDEEDIDRTSVRLMLEYVTDYVDQLINEVDRDVLIALVNANKERFVLHENCNCGIKRRILELDRGTAHPTVFSIARWEDCDIKRLECDSDPCPPSDGWYSYLDKSGKDALKDLLVETLVRAKEGKEGTFVLHWKNGERVRMGQHFIPVSAVTGSREGAQEVTGVSITNGTPRAYIYSGDVGYAVDACEPLLDGNDKVETTYNLNSYASDEFYCAKCRKKAPIENPTYCPSCGRRVL